MKSYTAVIEQDKYTRLYVGWVPGFPGAHSRGETSDALRGNLREVVEMLLEVGEPVLEACVLLRGLRERGRRPSSRDAHHARLCTTAESPPAQTQAA